MALSTATCDILKICKPLLEENKNAIGATFYRKLFSEHPGLRNTFNMSHQRPPAEDEPPLTGAQQLALGNALVAYCANCDQLDKLGPFVERVANKHVSFNVQPEQYPVVGGVLLATLEEVLGKETFNEAVKGAVAEAYFFLADIFISKEAEMRKSVESRPGGWSGWRRLRLVDKVSESRLYTSFLLAPVEGEQLVGYEPGQYLSLRLDIPGTEHSHARNYSLSDEPDTDPSGQAVYRITVKREEGGAVSRHLHDTAQPGDIFEAGVPCGDFVLQPGPGPAVFLGAGVGITPLLSMMKVSARRGNKNTLIYRASDAASHPFRREIEMVMAPANCVGSDKHRESRVHWMYSDDKDPGRQYTAANIAALVRDSAEAKFYICGPASFISASLQHLASLAVPTENVFYENFGPNNLAPYSAMAGAPEPSPTSSCLKMPEHESVPKVSTRPPVTIDSLQVSERGCPGRQ